MVLFNLTTSLSGISRVIRHNMENNAETGQGFYCCLGAVGLVILNAKWQMATCLMACMYVGKVRRVVEFTHL